MAEVVGVIRKKPAKLFVHGVFGDRNRIGHWILFNLFKPEPALFYYGTKAFNSGNLGSACFLFDKSSEYWMSADAVGKEGVCLLLSGKVDNGLRLIEQAKILRKGQSSTFEEFYEGLYYFFAEQSDKAIPFLEDASADPDYIWRVTKAFAVLYVDNHQYANAARLMEPYTQVEVVDEYQAYVVAALKLFAGKKSESKMLVDKFESENLMPFWKSRFDKLRAQIQNQINR
jgi:hypothetical protein